MKSLVISSILFIVLITCIIWNAIYIKEGTLRLTKLADELEDINGEDIVGRISRLEAEWQRFRQIADISCQHSDLNKIDLTIKEMKVRAETDSPEDYETARQTLIFLLKELSRLEGLAPESLI